MGKPVWNYLPIGVGALDRSPPLTQWVKDLMGGLPGFQILRPEGWFTHGHGNGSYVWAPPPAAADVVVEQLAQARHKRSRSFHLVLVPGLMTAYWRKHLSRAADFYCRIENQELWPGNTNYEPLLVFVALPFRSWEPKFKERAELLDRLAWLLLGPGVSEVHTSRHRGSLRKLFSKAWEIS